MAILTIDVLKEYLKDISGSTLDTDLTAMIDRAESIIAKRLGFPIPDAGGRRTLNEVTYTLYVDEPMFDKSSVLNLPIRPIASITSIHSDADLVYGSNTEILSDNYILDKEIGQITLKPTKATVLFSYGHRSNKIVCVAGYTSNDDDLVHAVAVYCSHIQRAKSVKGKKSVSSKAGTISFRSNTIPAEVEEILIGLLPASMLI